MAASAFATLGVAFLVQVVLNPDPVGMAYVAVVLTGLGPSVLDRPAFLTVGGALLTATVVTAELPDVGLGPAWVLPALAGFVFGTVLLTYRLRSITALGRANARAEELAASDSLTGLLNRYGLQRSGSDLTARAHARDEGIFVVFIDVDGLKQANDNHGHAFGDRVILAAASAARRLAAEGDLVARWGGDELVVVGVGPTPDPTSVTERLAAALDRTGLDRARWPGPLSVGVAGAPCEEGPLADLVDLVDRADRDMYRRRRDRRPGPSDLATPG